MIFEISNKIQNTDFFFQFFINDIEMKQSEICSCHKRAKSSFQGEKNYHTLFLTFNFPSNIILAHFQFFFFLNFCLLLLLLESKLHNFF